MLSDQVIDGQNFSVLQSSFSVSFVVLGSLKLLCLRRRGNVLPVYEVCPPVHLCPVHHHPHGARRGPSEGIWNSLRDTAHGASIPWQHHLP